ncbi:MAG: hypothetical protein ACD_20C00085G0002 [uncultured bacterium]|nr:MAG: hypothetical protein ACD_20C00085G0002 [uncultured bacterium]HBH17521.1 hypothetical protein [Cyanobacteria bacterium UBA9579]
MASYIPKLIGIGGSILLIGDAAKRASRKAVEQTKSDLTSGISDVYVKHQTAQIDSPLLEKIKTGFRKYSLDSKVLSGILTAKNLVTSSVKSVATYAVPLGLAAGAVLTPPPINAICAGLFLAGGAAVFGREVLGLGKGKQLP